MNEFLDKKEMEQLTGYRTPAEQINWLNKQGFIFLINGKHAPVVSRSYCRELLSGATISRLETEPNFAEVK